MVKTPFIKTVLIKIKPEVCFIINVFENVTIYNMIW